MEVPPDLKMFLIAVGGSLAVEVVNLYQLYQTEPFVLPPRYRSPLFWSIRIGLSLIGGGLAVAYSIDQPLLAANIGASTPLIIRAFTEGIKAPGVPDHSPAVAAAPA